MKKVVDKTDPTIVSWSGEINSWSIYQLELHKTKNGYKGSFFILLPSKRDSYKFFVDKKEGKVPAVTILDLYGYAVARYEFVDARITKLSLYDASRDNYLERWQGKVVKVNFSCSNIKQI